MDASGKRNIAHEFASFLALENPRFDRERFISAASLDVPQVVRKLTGKRWRTGDGKRFATYDEALYWADRVYEHTGNIIAVEEK